MLEAGGQGRGPLRIHADIGDSWIHPHYDVYLLQLVFSPKIPFHALSVPFVNKWETNFSTKILFNQNICFYRLDYYYIVVEHVYPP